MNCMTIFVIIRSSGKHTQPIHSRVLWPGVGCTQYKPFYQESTPVTEAQVLSTWRREKTCFWPAQSSPQVLLQSHQQKNKNYWGNVAFWNEFRLYHFFFSVAYSLISHDYLESLPMIVLLNSDGSSPYQVVFHLNYHNIVTPTNICSWDIGPHTGRLLAGLNCEEITGNYWICFHKQGSASCYVLRGIIKKYNKVTEWSTIINNNNNNK